MASMKGTRLPKCVVLGELVGGQEKKWTGCFLDVLRTFGINADERERRRTAEQGAEHSMVQLPKVHPRNVLPTERSRRAQIPHAKS